MDQLFWFLITVGLAVWAWQSKDTPRKAWLSARGVEQIGNGIEVVSVGVSLFALLALVAFLGVWWLTT